MESWSLNPTELNWDYCCTSSTRSSCEIRLDSDKTEKCLTNSKPHDEQQSCNGICIDSNDIICPDNPGYCVNANRACDGRKENACECSAPFKNSPFYKPPDTCISNRLTLYCGEREGAKFQNRQCYRPDDNHEYYQCLNRKDIGEDVLRTKPIFDSEKQVSNRKNYFQLFEKSNITNNSITCGNQGFEIDCLKRSFETIHCNNGIYNIKHYELCGATDFALHNGWINDEESKSESYLERNFIGKNLAGTDIIKLLFISSYFSVRDLSYHLLYTILKNCFSRRTNCLDKAKHSVSVESLDGNLTIILSPSVLF